MKVLKFTILMHGASKQGVELNRKEKKEGTARRIKMAPEADGVRGKKDGCVPLIS
jgi:hypothetical protein